MVCTANDLSAWKDFPKGLRVLLLDEDSNSAAEMKLKLESMDYIVSTFCNENEAISAILNKPESFHVAIVEVGTCNSNGSFKFLENAKDLPTIMTSNIHCLSTMMKCIALGAVEFLRKPLSDDKLRNIWQHVVHKAFNTGSSVLSDSLKPVKESVLSMLHLQFENEATTNENPENASPPQANDNEQSEGNDKYPAPSTPQLKQGARLLDDNDCHENTNCSTEKDDTDAETKFVETTCNNPTTEVKLPEEENHRPKETVVKEESDRNDGLKTEFSDMCPPRPSDKDSCQKDSNNATIVDNPSKTSGLHTSSGNKANRKKMKVDWTPELHKKFVQAVEQLGVDQAIPSRILELMKVEGLTRHNVASHLQKYRMHRRHILPKEDVDRRWPSHSRDQAMQRGYYPHKPIMAFPPYHPNHAATPASPVYPMWGPPTSNHPPGVRMWGPPPAYPPWQQTEGWHWKPYPGIHADAWGCPVMPPPPLPPHGSYSSFSQNTSGFHNSGAVNNSLVMPQSSFDFHPTEEVIDKVVKEAISKPWLPLPLGLKPPSAESVLSELSRQGISVVPPRINGSRAC